MSEEFEDAWNSLIELYSMLHYKPFRRIDYKHWETKLVRTIDMVTHALASVRDDNGKCVCSTSFPYSHLVRDHYVSQMHWLGRAPIQSTQTFERHHQVVKGYCDKASKKDMSKSVMTMVPLFSFTAHPPALPP